MIQARLRDSEKQIRENYLVEYSFANSHCYLATLSLTYINTYSESQVVADIEYEFPIWYQRYPIPLMVSAFDPSGSLIHLKSKGDWTHYCGHPDTDNKCVSGWRHFPDSVISDFVKSEEYRESVYAAIPYETSEEVKKRVYKEYLQRAIAVRWLRYLYLFVVVIIPLAWLIGGLFCSIIAIFSTIWAFCSSGFRAMKAFGFIKESAIAQTKRDESSKKEHYFYHCSRNPEGFERLRNENWDREQRESIKKEYSEIADKQKDSLTL